jgi:hypothetical protein
LLLVLLELGVVVGFGWFVVLWALFVLGEAFGAWEGEAEDEGVVWWFWLGLRLGGLWLLLFLGRHDVGLLRSPFLWFGLSWYSVSLSWYSMV